MRNLVTYLVISIAIGLFTITSSCGHGRISGNQKTIFEIQKFQKDLNREYQNPEESPLRGNFLKNFKEHPFYPINLEYLVFAKLIKTPNAEPFDFPTSSGRFKKYREFGKVYFNLKGKSYVLSVYQSLDLMEDEEYKDYLFLPFRDETNGKKTYGGGRYLDLKIPKDDQLVIDFNKAYQPYCAYNATDYNCPVVPEGNRLPIKIKAGVQYQNIYFH